MTADPNPPTASAPVEVCCGAGKGWSRPGGVFVLGCQLCPNSPTYWRRSNPPPDHTQEAAS